MRQTKFWLTVACSLVLLAGAFVARADIHPYAICVMTSPIYGEIFYTDRNVEPPVAHISFSATDRVGFDGGPGQVTVSWGMWLYIVPEETLDSDGDSGQVDGGMMGLWEIERGLSGGPVDFEEGNYSAATTAALTANNVVAPGGINIADFSVQVGD